MVNNSGLQRGEEQHSKENSKLKVTRVNVILHNTFSHNIQKKIARSLLV